MKDCIVITTINKPTKAIEEFAKLSDFQLIVVGDKKTPVDWAYPNVKYISIDDQIKSGFQLAHKLPLNHYSRKMLGYLEAIRLKSHNIIDTDDDNIPLNNFSFPEFEGVFDYVEDENGFVNIYQLFTSMNIWPRGLPLQLITKNYQFDKIVYSKKSKVGIWQGLADNDPDVDALYRLTSDIPCTFDKRKPVVLGNGTVCPFNTQNTKTRKELFSLLYLPTTVTFRYTDILRGLVAQPIMWAKGYSLGFTEATVYQERNPHNYFNDFKSEIPMYLTCESVLDIVRSNTNKNLSVEDNLFNAYIKLRDNKIVTDNELICLENWLADISKLV